MSYLDIAAGYLDNFKNLILHTYIMYINVNKAGTAELIIILPVTRK